MSQKVIVCDPGTGYIKIGFDGDKYPKATFPALIGRPMLRSDQVVDGVHLKPIMIGEQTSKHRSMLELSYPTNQAIVKNWNDMQLLLDYSFKRIGAENTKGRDIMMTEAVSNPLKNRQNMIALLFQKFGFGRVQFCIQALMSIFAVGQQSGLLVDSGDGTTHCIPVVSMHILKNNVQRLNIAGQKITNYLAKLLQRRGYAFNSTADFQSIRELKENMCFVSYDYSCDKRLAQQTTCFQKYINLLGLIYCQTELKLNLALNAFKLLRYFLIPWSMANSKRASLNQSST